MLHAPPELGSWIHLNNRLKVETVSPQRYRCMSSLFNKCVDAPLIPPFHYSVPHAQHDCFVCCHLVLLITLMLQCALSSCWYWSLTQVPASAIFFLLHSPLIKAYYFTELLPLRATGNTSSVEAHLKFISKFCVVVMQEDWMYPNKILAKSFLPFLT